MKIDFKFKTTCHPLYWTNRLVLCIDMFNQVPGNLKVEPYNIKKSGFQLLQKNRKF